MFKKIKPSIFCLTATLSFLMLYTQNLADYIAYFFIGLTIAGLILGLASLFLADDKYGRHFFARLVNPYEAFSLFCLPLTLMLLVYRFSLFSLLISPFTKYWFASFIFLISSLVILLIFVLARWEDASALFMSFTLLSYVGIVIYLSLKFKYQEILSILAVIFILSTVILFISSLFFLKNKSVFLAVKGNLLLLFVNLLLLLPLYFTDSHLLPMYIVLASIVFFSSILQVILWWSDKNRDFSRYKSSSALHLAYGLFSIYQFRENYLYLIIEQDITPMWFGLDWYYIFTLAENVLLFFTTLLLMRYILDFFSKKEGVIQKV